MDQPFSVGFSVAGQDVGLGLQESGAQVRQAATDAGGGKPVARLTDADGNVIGLIQEA